MSDELQQSRTSRRPRLSVVVMARNEAANLPRVLASVRFADEVIVGDTGSTDNTADLAQRSGARVVRCTWRGFGPTKAEVLSHATGEWVLSLDADEEITPELAAQIERAISSSPEKIVAYHLSRQANFLGRWIRHSGWFPDHVLRLYRNGRARMSDDLVHERIIPDGKTEVLSGLLRHYTDPTIDRYLDKMREYTRLSAEQLHERGRRCRWWDLAVRPAFMFVKTYFVKSGFLDGWQGFALAFLSSVHVFTKYARLKVLNRDGRETADVS